MKSFNSKDAAKQRFLPVMRALALAYQGFTALDAAGYRQRTSNLTVSQADVIFTLGNTSGLTCGEIGSKTLITKGTLTGVLDRLEQKHLLRRRPCPEDGRRTLIELTAEGAQVFESEFPQQIAWLKTRFDRLDKHELEAVRESLERLQSIF
jgi:MarR family 2-MHQ and catechol resistance regulon transcriptional repressor